MDTQLLKRCSDCGEAKPVVDNFDRNGDRGYRPECRECRKARRIARESHQTNEALLTAAVAR